MSDSLPLGAHLITSRLAYEHHGIYVGNGRVIHYGGYDGGRHRRPVEEVSLDQFAGGHAWQIRSAPRDAAQAEAVVRRARSRLGEDRYALMSNNCEHFCCWCISGVARSEQVDAWRQRLSRWTAPLQRLSVSRQAAI